MDDLDDGRGTRARFLLGLLLVMSGAATLVVTTGDSGRAPAVAHDVGTNLPAGYSVKVSTASQTDVALPGPLTSLSNGDRATITVSGPPGEFFGWEARQCKPGINIRNNTEYSPSQTGSCIDQGLSPAQRESTVQQLADVTKTTATGDYVVGVGTRTFDYETDDGLSSTTITCGPDNPCTMWLQLSVPSSVSNNGFVYFHYDLEFTVGGPTTTTSLGATTTTSAVATTTTTPGATTTSTTSGASTTTSTTATGITTTTVPPLVLTPTSLAPGGELSVTTTGWRAESTISATLASDPVTLGTLTADASGAASGAFTVPAGLAEGSHTLTLTGTGADGAARELTAALTLTGQSTTTPTTPGDRGGLTGALARAGSNVLRLAWNGFALMIAGALLVVTALRRQRLHQR